MTSQKKTYCVAYGQCISVYKTTSWNDACLFMRMCLADGVAVRSVSVVTNN